MSVSYNVPALSSSAGGKTIFYLPNGNALVESLNSGEQERWSDAVFLLLLHWSSNFSTKHPACISFIWFSSYCINTPFLYFSLSFLFLFFSFPFFFFQSFQSSLFSLFNVLIFSIFFHFLIFFPFHLYIFLTSPLPSFNWTYLNLFPPSSPFLFLSFFSRPILFPRTFPFLLSFFFSPLKSVTVFFLFPFLSPFLSPFFNFLLFPFLCSLYSHIIVDNVLPSEKDELIRISHPSPVLPSTLSLCRMGFSSYQATGWMPIGCVSASLFSLSLAPVWG